MNELLEELLSVGAPPYYYATTTHTEKRTVGLLALSRPTLNSSSWIRRSVDIGADTSWGRPGYLSIYETIKEEDGCEYVFIF